MAKAKETIYAVVTYPKTNKTKLCNGLHIYTKQTSNLVVMTAYYEEQAQRHDDRVTVLVPRETAEQMQHIWYTAYNNNYGRVMSREHKKRSILGHGELTDRELRRAMARGCNR
jgi:hypothetical protein